MKYIITAIILIIFTITAYAQNSYSVLKNKTERKRTNYSVELKAAQDNPEKQKAIISNARTFLLNDIDNYFEEWYGTQWSFPGHTRTPRNGHIACGYFITTVLLDMGFKIPRIKWAQMASEEMIKNMTSEIKRFRNVPITDIIKYIEAKGEGLYVVGLDCHVGFIYYHKNQMRFVHSNYYRPSVGVMSETLNSKNPLKDSKYRVIGKILDDSMIKKWIQGSDFTK